MKIEIDNKEVIRLLLVLMAVNGWWAFATWPKLGAVDLMVSPLIMVGLIPSLMLVVWLLVALFDPD